MPTSVPPAEPFPEDPGRWPHQPPAGPPMAPDPHAVTPPVDHPAPPTFQQPGYQQAAYQQAGYQPPTYQPPTYQQPGYQQAGYQQVGPGTAWFAPAAPPAPARRPERQSFWVPLLGVMVVVALLAGAAVYALGGRTSVLDAAGPSVGRTPQTTVPVSPSTTVPQRPRSTVPGSSNGGSSSGGSSSGGTTSDWNVVTDAIDPGVVDIQSRLPAGIGAGTGMVLTADGEILTNNHVVEGATQIVVTTVADGQTYRADIVGTDPGEDIAVLQLVGASDLPTIPLGNSDDVQVGDPVAAIGNAGGQGGDPVVATGKVVALDQQITASDQDGSNAETLTGMIQVDANVQPGDSGGPLADANGKAIGINTAASSGRTRYRTGANQGFAIPINRALAIAEQLEASGSGSSSTGSSGSNASTPGFLGVQVRSASGGGARIVAVETASPAAEVGLAAGDVIIAIDGDQVQTTGDLTAALQQHASGDTVTVTWTGSDGAQHHGSATLA